MREKPKPCPEIEVALRDFMAAHGTPDQEQKRETFRRAIAVLKERKQWLNVLRIEAARLKGA